MAFTYDQYQNLTIREKAYIKSHPHHLMIIKSSKETAFSETKKIFGKNGRNDKSDAFRHCFWSALLAKEIGYHNALAFTNAHESSPANPHNEKAMDLHNNKVGLAIGKNKGSKNILSMKCRSALRNGKLKIIRP